ncbi:uncharacterized protein LOC128985882 [Macrosteles quadrilineatus]|uniref:uncharacterized protein LOC128985882 n=1 Tax=Macrosteles quadrilineatus TaxID=74068 RepID=UPI0023E2E5DC|nr:uncharacterized protein LOC128985882 [Macrosteles quadrilineatus]
MWRVQLQLIVVSCLGCISYAEYLGCYRDSQGDLFKGHQQNFIFSLTPETCISVCERKNFQYAGLKSRILCLCDKNAPAASLKIDESHCIASCVGDSSKRCGGDETISVYTTKLATSESPAQESGGQVTENYVGCYKDNVNDRLLSGFFKELQKNSPEQCRNTCFKLGYLYAGVEYGVQCFCGDTHPLPSLLRDASQCSMTCPGSSDTKCGGRVMLSIYETGITDIPVFGNKLGCFEDEDPRVLQDYKQELDKTNSPQRCTNLCRSLGFHYAGVEYGMECFCGNSVKANTTRDAEDIQCNTPCPGDPFDTCGANWMVMAYRTGLSEPAPEAKKVACVSERSQPLKGFRKDFPRPTTQQRCAKLCYDKGFFYSTLISSSQCWCGDEGPSRIQASSEECGRSQVPVYETGYPAIAHLNHKDNYIGCFEDENRKFEGSKENFETHLTPEKCSSWCFNKGYLYSGTKNNNECRCSDKSATDSMTKVMDTECSSTCTGDSTKKCGGTGKLSIYSTGITDVPSMGKLLGCYKDEYRPRTLDLHKTDLEKTNSPRRCLNYCLALGFMFAGVEYQKECFCGNSRPNSTLDVPDSECESVCTGDPSQTCGGGWRVEAYRTGFGSNSEDPILPPSVATTKAPDKCELSQTVVNGQKVCRGTQVFYDSFQTSSISEQWQHIVKIADAPDYEFVTFTSDATNSYISDGKLVIKPTLIPDKDVKEGTIKVDGCTGLAGTRECGLTAFSYNILPPVRSARLHTRSSFNFRYGVVEIRASLPAGDWIVPELWLVPKDQSYGTNYLSGKIKIAMSRGNRYLTLEGKDLGSSVLESGVLAGPENNVSVRSVVNKISGSWNSVAHTFTLVWTPDNLSFYVDGQSQQALLPPSGRLSELLGLQKSEVASWETGSRLAPFDTDFYLSLGLSVGGSRTFPDGSVSGNKEKPWTNFKLKAMLNFWLNKETWRPTWEEDKSRLVIEYVKVTAL